MEKGPHGKTFVPVLVCCIAICLFVSCVGKSTISSHRVAKAELEPGTYSVIRYQDLAVDYLTTVAFLDREDDAYAIVPRGSRFAYKVSKGLQADDALQLAENFVRSHPSYNSTEIKAIRDPAGILLGYEVRPLYQPFVYGGKDVLDIIYSFGSENTIEVWVRLKDRIDRMLFRRR